MPVINEILSLINSGRANDIKHFSENGDDVQEAQLKSLLNKAQNTTIGRKYDFSSIKSVDEFKKRVPVPVYFTWP